MITWCYVAPIYILQWGIIKEGDMYILNTPMYAVILAHRKKQIDLCNWAIAGSHKQPCLKCIHGNSSKGGVKQQRTQQLATLQGIHLQGSKYAPKSTENANKKNYEKNHKSTIRILMHYRPSLKGTCLGQVQMSFPLQIPICSWDTALIREVLCFNVPLIREFHCMHCQYLVCIGELPYMSDPLRWWGP